MNSNFLNPNVVLNVNTKRSNSDISPSPMSSYASNRTTNAFDILMYNPMPNTPIPNTPLTPGLSLQIAGLILNTPNTPHLQSDASTVTAATAEVSADDLLQWCMFNNSADTPDALSSNPLSSSTANTIPQSILAEESDLFFDPSQFVLNNTLQLPSESAFGNTQISPLTATSGDFDYDFYARRASIAAIPQHSHHFKPYPQKTDSNSGIVSGTASADSTAPNSPSQGSSTANLVRSTSLPKKESLISLIRRSSDSKGVVNSAPKKRFKPREEELRFLMGNFEKNPFPDREERKRIADELGLEPKQILFWFQNRRAALKMNGIHVIKPNGDNPMESASVNANDGKAKSVISGDRPSFTPLMKDNAFFFVQDRQQDA